jgi:tetratricopeptide (TPR) repeat protein
MLGKNRQPDRGKQGHSPLPSDEELFGTPLGGRPIDGDIFAPHSLPSARSGDGSASPFGHADVDVLPQIPVATGRPSLHLNRLSNVQKLLLLGIVAIALALVWTQMAQKRREHRHEARRQRAVPAGMDLPSIASPNLPGLETPAARPPSTGDRRFTAESGRTASLGGLAPADAVEPRIPSPQPISLQLANQLHLNREYGHARAIYDQLHQRLPATDENQPLRDFLLLRMAQCSSRTGDVAQADTLFRTVSLSRLPILRALARYHQSTILLERKRYLEAAVRAYQTIGLIEVTRIDEEWVSAVQRQCWFLVAEAVSRNLLSLSDADANLPAELWGRHPDIDPFLNMDEPQLRVFLTSGSERLDEAALGPQIRGTSGDNARGRWSVICNGASIEELLARFATNAGLNVRWIDSGPTAPIEENIRRRPVYLYLPSGTVQQVIAVAAGGVGLLAQLDARGNINVIDPTSYSSLSQHTKLLAEESISLWQRFLLMAGDDQRIANAHFALGLLQAARGQFDEAIAEYKLVANRSAKHVLAPHALLEAGKLKVRLRDYVGAHADFKQLVEMYSETELADMAYLHLADATMKAGMFGEAAGLYRRVYNLGLSAATQASSALGAGRCAYEMQDYEQAAQWLNRYVALARHQNRPEFHTACLLLGKTYLALQNPQQAHVALNLALQGDLSRPQYVETVTVLVRAYIEQGLFLEALQTLEGTSGWQLSQHESAELLLLRAQMLRSIGLAEKALALLRERGQFMPTPELKARAALETASCSILNDDLESARKTLSDAFALAEPGPLAQEIGRELARTCLRLGHIDQAVSICSQLLEHASGSERQPLLELLAETYRRQGQYDRAVATLLNRRNGAMNSGKME